MSKQALIKTMFQVALDNGANLKATVDDVTIEAQPPPQTRRCTKNEGKGSQCKNRVALDSKWKFCYHCRGIKKKSQQKHVAAFRADSVAQAAAAAQVVVPPGEVRCSNKANTPNWCKRTFSSNSKFKHCAECRESGKKSQKKRYADPEIRDQQLEYHRAYDQTPAGKASKKRSSKKPVTKLRNCLRHALKHAGVQSRTLKQLGTFYSNEDIKAHFESTFAAWMMWDNHGVLRHTDGYKKVWHIGHRIPCALYELHKPDDARKCFDRRNLYAQDARENIELSDRLVLTDAELLALKPIWPNSAHYMSLEEFKEKFANATETSRAVLAAKLEAERVRAEILGESADTAGDEDDDDDEDEYVPDDDELFDDEVEEDAKAESDEEESEEGEECE